MTALLDFVDGEEVAVFAELVVICTNVEVVIIVGQVGSCEHEEMAFFAGLVGCCAYEELVIFDVPADSCSYLASVVFAVMIGFCAYEEMAIFDGRMSALARPPVPRGGVQILGMGCWAGSSSCTSSSALRMWCMWSRRSRGCWDHRRDACGSTGVLLVHIVVGFEDVVHVEQAISMVLGSQEGCLQFDRGRRACWKVLHHVGAVGRPSGAGASCLLAELPAGDRRWQQLGGFLLGAARWRDDDWLRLCPCSR